MTIDSIALANYRYTSTQYARVYVHACIMVRAQLVDCKHTHNVKLDTHELSDQKGPLTSFALQYMWLCYPNHKQIAKHITQS